MWAALFGSTGSPTAENGVLILRPDPSAVTTVAGFKGGAELRLTTDSHHRTVAALLENLNIYRTPQQQIRRIWSETGEEIVGSHEVRGEVRAVVRAASLV